MEHFEGEEEDGVPNGKILKAQRSLNVTVIDGIWERETLMLGILDNVHKNGMICKLRKPNI